MECQAGQRLFASELLPEFKERDRDYQRRRQEWLAQPAQATAP